MTWYQQFKNIAVERNRDMIVRKLRLARGWSQEQLAQMCDLNIRTIQRIERGQKPSLESLKALAAVFETDITDFTEEVDMSNHSNVSAEEARAILYVRDIKGFKTHIAIYIIGIAIFITVNLIIPFKHFWAIWPALGWGLGVTFHGLNVYEFFNFFGPDWEKRQIQKRLKKDL
jgi:transcriptional regulator with XRE-family HTH domain